MIHKLPADGDTNLSQSDLSQITQVLSLPPIYYKNSREPKFNSFSDVKPPVVKKRTKTKKELENQVSSISPLLVIKNLVLTTVGKLTLCNLNFSKLK